MTTSEENNDISIGSYNVYRLTLLTIYFYKKQFMMGNPHFLSTSVKQAKAFMKKQDTKPTN